MSGSTRDPLRLPTLSALLGAAMVGVGAVVALTWLLVVAAPWVGERRESPLLGEDGSVLYPEPARIDGLAGSVVALAILLACLAAVVLLWPVAWRTRAAQRRGAVVAVLVSSGGAVIGAAGLLGRYGMELPAFYAVVLLVSLLLLGAAAALLRGEPRRGAVAAAP